MADFFQKRSVFIQIIVISIAILLVLQLFFIQILGGGGYKSAAENQAVKRKIIYHSSGTCLCTPTLGIKRTTNELYLNFWSGIG